MPRAFKAAAYAYVASMGKALAAPVRLEILDLLAQADHTVEALAGELGQSAANTSHHLQVLKRARLVVSEVDGVRRCYRLADDDVGRLVAALQAMARRHLAPLDELTRSTLTERDGLQALSRQELLSRLQQGRAVLVDVRPEREFVAGHLPGARSLPLAELAARVAELPEDKTIVAYCRGPFCTFAADAARQLRALGFDARRADVSVHHPLEATHAPS